MLANDTDTESDSRCSRSRSATGAAHGTLSARPRRLVHLHAGRELQRADSFTYKANDGTADSNVATVTITVNPVNDAPVATDDASRPTRTRTLTVAAPGVLANDTDTDGDALLGDSW